MAREPAATAASQAPGSTGTPPSTRPRTRVSAGVGIDTADRHGLDLCGGEPAQRNPSVRAQRDDERRRTPGVGQHDAVEGGAVGEGRPGADAEDERAVGGIEQGGCRCAHCELGQPGHPEPPALLLGQHRDGGLQVVGRQFRPAEIEKDVQGHEAVAALEELGRRGSQRVGDEARLAHRALRGRPSTRSATSVRWISMAPP